MSESSKMAWTIDLLAFSKVVLALHFRNVGRVRTAFCSALFPYFAAGLHVLLDGFEMFLAWSIFQLLSFRRLFLKFANVPADDGRSNSMHY